MSVQAISWVLDHSPTRGTDRLVLISLANHAGESPVDGAWESYPGVRRIAREARLDRVRTAQDALARLERAGHIERIINGAPDRRIRPDRRPNLYRILLDQRGDEPRHPASSTGVSPRVTPSAPRGDARRHIGVTRGDTNGVTRRVTQTVISNRHKTPSGTNVSRAEPSASPVDGSAAAELIDQAVTEASKRYAQRRSQSEAVGSIQGLAAWWRREHGTEAADRASRLVRYYDLTATQLADALLSPNGRWLDGHRRRPEAGSEQ